MELANSMNLMGRKAKPLVAHVAGELDLGQLGLLAEERGTQAQPIKALRSKHHKLAKALAAGMSQTEAAYMVGFTPSRVSILRADPTFEELEAHYRAIDTEAFRDAREKLGDLAEDAVDILHDRVIGDPDNLTTDELLQIGKFAADRSGNGPSTKTVVDVKIGLADRLEAARIRREAMRVIHVEDAEIVSEESRP